MDFFKLLNGFVKIFTWISLGCYMDLSKLIIGSCYVDLSKLLFGFVKVVKWIRQGVQCFSRPLPNKNKLNFDRDFKASDLN